MGVSNAEIAQYVEAGVETLFGIIFVVWGLFIARYMSTFLGRKSDYRRSRMKYILYILGLGCFIMSASIWILSQGGGTVVRTDGVTSEYGRQIGYAFGATAVAIALAIYGKFTLAGGSITAISMLLTFTAATLASVSTSTHLYWVIMSFWGFFIVVGAFSVFLGFGIKPTPWYSNFIAAGLLYLYVILSGLWLILGPQITDSFSHLTETALYTATGILMLAIGFILAISYTSTRSLFEQKPNAPKKDSNYPYYPKMHYRR